MKKFTTELVEFLFVLPLILSSAISASGQQTSGPAAKLTPQQQKAKDDVKLGEAARKNHAIGEAIADYKAAILADPSDPEAHRRFIQMTIYSVELSR